MDKAQAVKQALDWLTGNGYYIPSDLLKLLAEKGFKTYEYFLKNFSGLVKSLYNDNVTRDEFIDTIANLISGQLTMAWGEGMEANGLDPVEDMTDEWSQILQDIISNEYTFVDGFAADIVSARESDADNKGASLDGLLARAGTWANRYPDVVNQAVAATAEGKDRYEWIEGDTENKCNTCLSLNGIVAFAWEWELSGFRPQSPPNDLLDCKGFKCDCELRKTDKHRSPKALDTLMNLAVARNM